LNHEREFHAKTLRTQRGGSGGEHSLCVGYLGVVFADIMFETSKLSRKSALKKELLMKIAYYPVGTVHMRNLELLSKALPDFDFRVFYRTSMPWFTPEKTKEYPYERVLDTETDAVSKLLSGDVRALILSIVALNEITADLIEAALEKNIPIIAIEEVIQLGLNNGAINHYLMPVDHLLAASDYERDAFVDLGIDPARVCVTGWPFYSGTMTGTSAKRREALRRRWQVPDNKLVVALFLSKCKQFGDYSSIETLLVRQQILSIVREGITDRFHLVIKLHPTEDIADGRRSIEPFFKNATIVEGPISVNDILDMADVCLNRGNSQVVIEALMRDIPVLAMPCGIGTIFDVLAEQVAIKTPERLTEALNYIADGGKLNYHEVKQTHFPWKAEEALNKTAVRIREIAKGNLLARNGEEWLNLALYRGLVKDTDGGLRALGKLTTDDSELLKAAEFLQRLLGFRAAIGDVEFLVSKMDTAYQQSLILSLWIQQLQQLKRAPSMQELDLFVRYGPYPPRFNTHNHLRHAVTLAHLYINAGVVEPAFEILEILSEQYGFLARVKNLAERLSDYCVCHSC
jgi:hypothetical protein